MLHIDDFFRLQVIYSEKFKSLLLCSENEFVGGHDSLYRTYLIYSDLKHLLLFLLIPHSQLIIIIIEPYQVEWGRYMTQWSDPLPSVVMVE